MTDSAIQKQDIPLVHIRVSDIMTDDGSPVEFVTSDTAIDAISEALRIYQSDEPDINIAMERIRELYDSAARDIGGETRKDIGGHLMYLPTYQEGRHIGNIVKLTTARRSHQVLVDEDVPTITPMIVMGPVAGGVTSSDDLKKAIAHHLSLQARGSQKPRVILPTTANKRFATFPSEIRSRLLAPESPIGGLLRSD